MNDGVAMLLERMKTNPEEFLGVRDGKWESLVYRFHEYLDPQDYAIFRQELTKIMQQRFTEQVMEELIDPKKSSLEDVINHYRVKGMASVTTTPQQSSVVLNDDNTVWSGGKITLTTQPDIKQHEKAHKTLFGKLFNYA